MVSRARPINRPTGRRRRRWAASESSSTRRWQAGHPMTVRQIFYRLHRPARDRQDRGRVQGDRRPPPGRHEPWPGRCPSAGSRTTPAGCGKPRSLQLLVEACCNTAGPTAAIWGKPGRLRGGMAGEGRPGRRGSGTSRLTWDVPLMVTRGSRSSYLHEAAEAMRHQEKPVFLYYFGDHDPSGLDITGRSSGIRSSPRRPTSRSSGWP